MSPREQAAVERLSELARDAAPPPLAEAAARRMVRDAAMQGRARGRRRARWRAGAAVAAAATVLLALGTALVLRDDPAADGATMIASDPVEPLRMELPTGDRITAAPGARFRLDSSERVERRVSLESGTMLFDVATLGEGSSFEVVTPHLRTQVLGTVFSVQATEDGTVVRVFEGRVEVDEERGADEPSTRRLVRARQATRSGSAEVEPLGEDSPLAEEGWRVAAAREHAGVSPTAGAASEPPPAEAPAEQGPDTAASDADDAARTPAPDPHARVRTPDEARRLVALGDARIALEASRARARATRGTDRARWAVAEGDALRALRRWESAADAYERAAPELPRTEAVRAGYTAASIRFHRLADPAGALAALERAHADTEGSPLEERALALRARALLRTGREEEARAAARRYLDRFGDEGGMADWMRGLQPE